MGIFVKKMAKLHQISKLKHAILHCTPTHVVMLAQLTALQSIHWFLSQISKLKHG